MCLPALVKIIDAFWLKAKSRFYMVCIFFFYSHDYDCCPLYSKNSSLGRPFQTLGVAAQETHTPCVYFVLTVVSWHIRECMGQNRL